MDWLYIIIKLIVAFILMNVALTIVAFIVYFERKVAAHMQARQGSAVEEELQRPKEANGQRGRRSLCDSHNPGFSSRVTFGERFFAR